MIAMNHLPPPPHTPPPTHGVLSPPMPPKTIPAAQPQPQPQPQASSALGLQPAQLQQQPHANCNTVTQAAAIPGVNAAQSAPSKPGSRIWRWFLKLLRVCAALLASGSIILFIYYQLRADRRDERNLEYTANSYNLSVWSAYKEYCDFHLSHDNNFNADTCLVDPPPVKFPKNKRWLQDKTAVWDYDMVEKMIQYFYLAMALISLVYGLRAVSPVAETGGSNSALYTKSDQVAESRVSGANLTAGRQAQKKRHIGHPLRTLDIV